MNTNVQRVSLSQASEQQRRKFMVGVYNWMLLALVISAAAAFFTVSSETMLRFIFGSNITFFGLIIAEFALVFFLSSRLRTMSVSTATFCFLLYSVLNGITLSSILLVYTGTSVFQVFIITALMFGGMSLYAMTTKTDLQSMGRYLMMALIGVIIASVVNIFLRSSGLDWMISIVAVVLFTGLTAYDTQKLMKISVNADDSEAFKKVAIFGALQLYLDFINLFLALLRLFGNRR